MKSHRRFHSEGSGWVSALSEDTMGQDGLMNVETAPGSTPATQDLLVDIPLGDESSGTGASFLPEDHSRDGSSAATIKTRGWAKNRTLTVATVAGIVDEVLLGLQRARQGRGEERAPSIPEKDANRNEEGVVQEETPAHTSPEGLQELKHPITTCNRNDLPSGDVELMRRVEDFHRARFLRQQQGHSKQPCCTFGLFRFLSDLQLDLEWAEDAAWRRINGKVYLSWSDFQAIHKQTLQPTYFVYGMMALSTILLLVSFFLNDWEFAPVKVNPLFGPNPEVLFRMGALDRMAVLEDGEWYRLVAPMFLHAGLIHFALNMVALFFIGGTVECRHGTAETILVFLLTAIGGNMASTLFMSPSTSVGASGGIFGLLGVCVADVMLNWDLLNLKNRGDIIDPAYKGFPFGMVLFWLAIEVLVNVLVGLTPYVDQLTHIVGLFFGVGFGIPFLQWLNGHGFFGSNSSRRVCVCRATRFCLFVATMASFVTMMFLLLNTDGEPLCENCGHLSCVPFPFWKADRWWECDKCDLTIGTIDRFAPTTVVELTCPGFGTMKVDLLEADVDRTLIQENLSTYCRENCPM